MVPKWTQNTDPIGSTYAREVYRESVRIAFTYAALNGKGVCAAVIRNAYLQALFTKKGTLYVALSLRLKMW